MVTDIIKSGMDPSLATAASLSGNIACLVYGTETISMRAIPPSLLHFKGARKQQVSEEEDVL